MGLNSESCNDDKDCPFEQFCYVSKRCVDYLDCSRYNRMKGQILAREPSQCGPCIKGYEFEILANGQQTRSCKYIQNEADVSNKNQVTIIVVSIVTVILLILILLGTRYFYKRYRARQIRRSNNASDIASEVENNSNKLVVASAPPEEEKPFIGFGEQRCSIPDNNNKTNTETVEYQNTFPFTRRTINAYTTTNNTNSYSPNLPSRQVAVIENQHDRNTELPQNDFSDHNDDNLSNDDYNGDTIDSASETHNKSNENKSSKMKSNVILNQVLNQNITINMNGEEY
ncbi:uncharacterized protein [Anoplolepis gracilipes]|uniref:uncharacterized protein isoform X2 n=1 Tax=Anoplolepis gracilipes TaxID=354296 RepID=UPI003B9F45DD